MDLKVNNQKKIFITSLIILAIIPSIILNIYQERITNNINEFNNLNLNQLIKQLRFKDNKNYQLDRCLINYQYEKNLIIEKIKLTFNQSHYYDIFHVETSAYKKGLNYFILLNSLKNSLIQIDIFKHNETPGLGDKIESEKSDWLIQFNNIKQQNIKNSSFDIISGATITSKALINSIKNFFLKIKVYTCKEIIK